MNEPDQMLKSAEQNGDTLELSFWYPRTAGAVNKLVVGMCDVRATEDIRISFDFDRNGWKIEQESIYEWDEHDKVCDPGWKEVAFINSWALDKRP